MESGDEGSDYDANMGGLGSPALKIHAIVASLRDTIRAQQLQTAAANKKGDGKHPASEREPTPTEYFAAIMAVFRGAEVDFVPEFLQILAAVTPKCNATVVQSQFSYLSSSLLAIMQSYKDDASVLRNCLDVLGAVCCHQETTDGFWAKADHLRVVSAVLAFVDDARTVVRRECADQIKRIATLHKSRQCKSLRQYVADFCGEVLKACTRSSYKRPLFVLMFLEPVIGSLLDSDAAKLANIAIGLVECEQPVVTAAAYRVVDCMFQSPTVSLSRAQAAGLLQAVMGQLGASVDMEANTFYFSIVASAVLYMQRAHPDAVNSGLISKVLSCFVHGCESDFTQVHIAVANGIKRIINTLLPRSALMENAFSVVNGVLVKKGGASGEGGISAAGISLTKSVAKDMEQFLHMGLQKSWTYSLDGVRFFFEQLAISIPLSARKDARFIEIVAPLIKAMAGIVSLIAGGLITVSQGADTALEDVLVSAMSCLGGPSNFLAVIAPSDAPASRTMALILALHQNISWLPRFFDKNIKNIVCSLDDFATNFVPVIEFLRSKEAKGLQLFSGMPQQRVFQIIEALETNVCALFAQYTSNHDARDIGTGFPKVIGIITSTFNAYIQNKDDLSAIKSRTVHGIQDICLSLLLGMGNAARCIHAQLEDANPEMLQTSVLSQHSQTVIPLYVTFLEACEIHDKLFRAAIQALEAWAVLAPQQLLSSVAKKLLQLLLMSSGNRGSESTDDGAAAAKWMSIILSLLPRLNAAMVQLLYRTIKPLLSVNESVTIQKRSYHVLRGILANRPKELFSFESPMAVLSVLGESFLIAHVSARHMRLECMETVIRAMEQQAVDADYSQACSIVLGETLISQKDSNRKCRIAAVSLLRCLIQRVPSGDFFFALCSAVAGETPSMRSSAINGIVMLLLERRASDPTLVDKIISIIPTISVLLRENNTEETRSILSLYRAVVSAAPIPTLTPILGSILHNTLVGTGELKTKFMNKAKKIVRKALNRLGLDIVQPLIPQSDSGLLMYLDRLSRRHDRKKRGAKSVGGKSQRGSVVDMNDGEDSDAGDDSASDGDSESIYTDIGTQGQAKTRMTEKSAVDEMTMIVNRKLAEQRNASATDYRLGARAKADFASSKDFGRHGNSSGFVPMSLDDLMEDQTPRGSVGMSHSSGAKKTGKRGRGEEESTHSATARVDPKVKEQYSVRVDDSGMLVVEENEDDMEVEHQSEDGNAAADLMTKRIKVEASESNKPQRPAPKAPGEEYKAKNAGGDVWKKGMLEPHAYVPLDGRMLTKKNTDNAVTHFGQLMKNNRDSNGRHEKNISRSQRRAKLKHSMK